MGIRLADDDIALRCNLVTLSDEADYSHRTMLDYSAGEITTQEAGELIGAVAEALNGNGLSFYPGVSYRHCLVWKKGPMDIQLTPPHDISGKSIKDHLPKGNGSDLINDLMRKSVDILKDHPVNKKRIERGLNPATSIWLWGQGRKPAIPLFVEKYGLCGSVISAVDLIKGIGIASGMKAVEVEGATGNIHTNFKGKAEAALKELREGRDFVYIHVEAPDECGHQGQLKDKIRSIELIDRDVLGVLLKGLEGEDYSLLILPDHPTPIAIKTHSSDPVPYLIYRSGSHIIEENAVYTEAYCKDHGETQLEGFRLMDRFLQE
jgi:2,3-bisphosphoglycerate-independent phosphoglycerate mutase